MTDLPRPFGLLAQDKLYDSGPFYMRLLRHQRELSLRARNVSPHSTSCVLIADALTPQWSN
jgi:hypothetical protein